MLVLFDPQDTERADPRAFPGHTIHTAQAKGWDTLSNGALLSAAESAAVDVLLTTDRRMRHQQNLSARRIALVVLTGSTKWSCVRQHTDRIAAAVCRDSRQLHRGRDSLRGYARSRLNRNSTRREIDKIRFRFAVIPVRVRK